MIMMKSAAFALATASAYALQSSTAVFSAESAVSADASDDFDTKIGCCVFSSFGSFHIRIPHFDNTVKNSRECKGLVKGLDGVGDAKYFPQATCAQVQSAFKADYPEPEMGCCLSIIMVTKGDLVVSTAREDVPDFYCQATEKDHRRGFAGYKFYRNMDCTTAKEVFSVTHLHEENSSENDADFERV